MTRKIVVLAAILGIVPAAFLLAQLTESTQPAPDATVGEAGAATPQGPASPLNLLTSPANKRVRITYPSTGVAAGSAATPQVQNMPLAGPGTGTGSMMGSGGTYPGEMMGESMGPMPGATSGPQFQQRLAQANSNLRQAKTTEEKEQARKAVEKLLGDYFDSDMKRRQQELDRVKERVARLEALLQKRQAAKQEIIDLQLKTMVNESEGLGFFSEPISGAPGMSGGYGEDKPDFYGAYYGYGGEGYGGGMYRAENAPAQHGSKSAPPTKR